MEPKYLSGSIKRPCTDKVFVLIMYEIQDSIVGLWKEVCVGCVCGVGRWGGGRMKQREEGAAAVVLAVHHTDIIVSIDDITTLCELKT